VEKRVCKKEEKEEGGVGDDEPLFGIFEGIREASR